MQGMFIDFAFLVLLYFNVFLPIIKSFRKVKVEKPEKLQKLLSNERGLKFFELYAATELSLENVLFFRSVLSWKKRFQAEKADVLSLAEMIDSIYLSGSSTLELNISHNIKSEAQAAIKQKNISLELFDSCLKDVLKLMVSSRLSIPLALSGVFIRPTIPIRLLLNLTSTNSILVRLHRRKPPGSRQADSLRTRSWIRNQLVMPICCFSYGDRAQLVSNGTMSLHN